MADASPRDYVAIAKAYAQAAIKDKGRKKHGRLIRAAAQRFIDDLKRAKQKGAPFYFDDWHATDACDFIEKLPHVEGEWDTPDIVMHASHIFFVVQLFGFRDAKTKRRRYTSALFAVARKNAKSTLSAGILLYCLCCEHDPGAQVISAATTFPQASIIFNVAKRMVEKLADLRQAFGLQVWAKSVSRMETGGSFKPIHAKASTQDGLNPSHVGLDEIHAHKSPDLVNVLKSAAGARKSALWLYTTTEGFLNPGPWSDLRRMARAILLAGLQADHFLVVFYALDDEDKEAGEPADDEFDESTWIKANPLMEVNPQIGIEMRKLAIEARAMPSTMAEFRIKRLNRQASTANGWVHLGKWKACGGALDLEWLAKYPCIAALDLSSVSDLTSVRYTWLIDGVYYTYGRRWVPEAAVEARGALGIVPYPGWKSEGLIEVTPGDVIDYDYVVAGMLADKKRFNIQRVMYDDWNAKATIRRLEQAGFVMENFVQGTKSFHPAMLELERAYMKGQLHHGGDPVLAWCASNLIVRRDANLNMAPDKKRSPDKIDEMTTLLMGVGGWMSLPAPKVHKRPFIDLNAA